VKKIIAAIAAVMGLLLAALTLLASRSKNLSSARAAVVINPGASHAAAVTHLAESPGFSPAAAQALSNVSISRGRAVTLATIAIAVLVIGSAAALAGVYIEAQKQSWSTAASMTKGSPARGRDAIALYGCGSCHSIPGVRNADALVGPPLDRIGSRAFVGGVVRNTPDNLIRWIQNPPAIDEKTAMPNLGVAPTDARDIAAYLYTLR
jgi:cytochrome c2